MIIEIFQVFCCLPREHEESCANHSQLILWYWIRRSGKDYSRRLIMSELQPVVQPDLWELYPWFDVAGRNIRFNWWRTIFIDLWNKLFSEISSHFHFFLRGNKKFLIKNNCGVDWWRCDRAVSKIEKYVRTDVTTLTAKTKLKRFNMSCDINLLAKDLYEARRPRCDCATVPIEIDEVFEKHFLLLSLSKVFLRSARGERVKFFPSFGFSFVSLAIVEWNWLRIFKQRRRLSFVKKLQRGKARSRLLGKSENSLRFSLKISLLSSVEFSVFLFISPKIVFASVDFCLGWIFYNLILMSPFRRSTSSRKIFWWAFLFV